jgi:hypothetical protein
MTIARSSCPSFLFVESGDSEFVALLESRGDDYWAFEKHPENAKDEMERSAPSRQSVLQILQSSKEYTRWRPISAARW